MFGVRIDRLLHGVLLRLLVGVLYGIFWAMKSVWNNAMVSGKFRNSFEPNLTLGVLYLTSIPSSVVHIDMIQYETSFVTQLETVGWKMRKKQAYRCKWKMVGVLWMEGTSWLNAFHSGQAQPLQDMFFGWNHELNYIHWQKFGPGSTNHLRRKKHEVGVMLGDHLSNLLKSRALLSWPYRNGILNRDRP